MRRQRPCAQRARFTVFPALCRAVPASPGVVQAQHSRRVEDAVLQDREIAGLQALPHGTTASAAIIRGGVVRLRAARVSVTHAWAPHRDVRAAPLVQPIGITRYAQLSDVAVWRRPDAPLGVPCHGCLARAAVARQSAAG